MQFFKITKRIILFSAGMTLAAVIAWLLLPLVIPPPLEAVKNWPVSPALLDDRGQLFHVRLSQDEEWCLPVPLERMGKWLPDILVEVEDKRFNRHPGLDPLALGRAAFSNLLSGKVVSGASTITSQLVRIARPSERSLTAKIREFCQALSLERRLSKKEILELYLNRAPFGGPVRGVEAAARTYFRKHASELSAGEAATLIGMLKGPSLYRPDRNPQLLLARRDRILRLIKARGLLDQAGLERALLEIIPPGRGAMPAQGRHFADQALALLPADYWTHGSRPLRTSLNLRQQDVLERRLKSALTQFPPEITAAAALVDNKSGELTAYVGNARLDPDANRHWVDCGASPRSPGSALKPFAYLTAFEQGRLLPGSLLADTPISFSGRAPRNFDRLYRGPVSAAFALAESLNAPAVRVLRLASPEVTLQTLRHFGFRHLDQDARHYGDSLVLGGCETTLLELVQAYSALARLGLWHPLRYYQNDAEKEGGLEKSPSTGRVASEEAAWLTADVLRDSARLSPLQQGVMQREARAVAFKTGTSYGLRDAWTLAYTPDWTMGVWLGDPSGESYPDLGGLQSAAPIALETLRRIEQSAGTAREWYTPPPGLEERNNCALSGQVVGPHCPSIKKQWAIRRLSNSLPCSMHVQRDGQIVTLWPPELIAFIHSNPFIFFTSAAVPEAGRKPGPKSGRAMRPTAPHLLNYAPIEISSPRQDSRFFVMPGNPPKTPLRSSGAIGKVYWFVDDELYVVQDGEDPPFWPLAPGRHVVSLVDESGRSARVNFNVHGVGEAFTPEEASREKGGRQKNDSKNAGNAMEGGAPPLIFDR